MFQIMADEAAVVVAAHAERGLGQVVGAEAEKLRLLGDLVGDDTRPRQFDHGADQVAHRHPLLGKDFLGGVVHDLRLSFELS